MNHPRLLYNQRAVLAVGLLAWPPQPSAVPNLMKSAPCLLPTGLPVIYLGRADNAQSALVEDDKGNRWIIPADFLEAQ